MLFVYLVDGEYEYLYGIWIPLRHMSPPEVILRGGSWQVMRPLTTALGAVHIKIGHGVSDTLRGHKHQTTYPCTTHGNVYKYKRCCMCLLHAYIFCVYYNTTSK